jgi:hypothetical protein
MKLISRAETAQMLGVKESTLAVWACTKRYGLDYIKIGSRAMYQLDDVLKFVESHRVRGEYIPKAR